MASLVAIVMTVTILFGSTFAWQSISQEALNEVRGIINPGGRLHDDFMNITYDKDGNPRFEVKTFDKNVYVENFTSVLTDGVPVYARVRLDEYMEFGTGAGSEDPETNQAEPLVAGTELMKKSSWTTFIPEAEDGATLAYRKYWTWTYEHAHEDGATIYMPTFNKDNTSLSPDINGTFAADFLDYQSYEAGDTKKTVAYYSDGNGGQKGYNETHTAKSTLGSTVITMEEWMTDYNSQPGEYWVWDTDGWAYWASPIMPSTATGLLLDQIQRTTTVIEQEWYYGINVVAQFITYDNLGNHTEPKSGFFTDAEEAPQENALKLLEIIGVDVQGTSGSGETGNSVETGNSDSSDSSDQSGTSGDAGTQSSSLTLRPPEGAAVPTEQTLKELLLQGGELSVVNDITLTSTAMVGKKTTLSLGGKSLSAAQSYEGDALFIVGAGAWLDVAGGSLKAPDGGYAVRVENNALLSLWDGTYKSGSGVIYVDKGTVTIIGGTFELPNDGGRLIDWNQDNYEAGEVSVVVYGGTFHNFDPSDVDGVNLVAEGYRVVSEVKGDDTVYTVVEVTEAAQEEVTPNQQGRGIILDHGISGKADAAAAEGDTDDTDA